MPSAESQKSISNKSKKNRAAKTIQKGFRLTRRKPKAMSTQNIPSELLSHIHGYAPRSGMGASDKSLWNTHKKMHGRVDEIKKKYKTLKDKRLFLKKINGDGHTMEMEMYKNRYGPYTNQTNAYYT